MVVGVQYPPGYGGRCTVPTRGMGGGGIYTTRVWEEEAYIHPGYVPGVPLPVYTTLYIPGYTMLDVASPLVNGAAVCGAGRRCSGLWSEINNGEKGERASQDPKGVRKEALFCAETFRPSRRIK